MNDGLQIMNVPEIRFPEFKDDWEETRLGTLIYKTDKKNKENLNLPVYSINNTEGFIPQAEQFEGRNSNDRGFDISIYKIINESTFAYNPARINVGSIGYSYELNNVLVSSLYVCFKTDQQLGDTFLLQFLKTYSFSTSVLRYEEGGVRKYLFFDNISKIPISIPTIPEQKRIANFFSVLDNKINQLKEKKTLLEDYKKGMMQRIFTVSELGLDGLKDDRISDVEKENPKILKSKKSKFRQLRFKDDDGKEFSDWEEKKIMDLGDVITGSTPPTSNRNYYKGDFLFVSPGDIQSNRFVTQTQNTLTKGGFAKGRKIKKRSTLFVCIGGTIGKIAQAGVDCVSNQQINSVIPINNNDDFVFFLLQYHSKYIASFAAQQAVPILNKSTFANISINIPSLPEQTKIANFLTKIDDKIKTINEQIDESKEYKKGLLQKMYVV